MLTSDASGAWGCGAWWETRWFQLQWLGLGESASYGITAKVLLPIVVVVASWGKAWQGKAVLARCDNMAVVAIVNSGSSREAEAMHLRRCLAFLEAKRAIQLWAEHVRGVDNEVADSLSRNRLDQVFHRWSRGRRQWTRRCCRWLSGKDRQAGIRTGSGCGKALREGNSTDNGAHVWGSEVEILPVL